MNGVILKMPKTESDGLNGINDSGIETYKNIPMLSLTKEELQNSCDASLKNGQPVVVQFSDFYMDIKEIPSGEKLLEVYKQQRDFWDDYMTNDKKVVEFFDNGIKLLEKGKIRVLRISDYNTTGLKGIDGKSSPWNNLVKNRYVSDKPGYAGGSFGIGKDAAFACSELRTVFYNTLNEDNDKAFQGTVRLPSYEYNCENFTGDVFFSKDDGNPKANNAIRENISLEPSYTRLSTGMDKYIFGFGEGLEKENLKKELIVSSINNYLYAFYTGRLIVEFDDVLVDKDHLDDLFIQYRDEIDKVTRDYYDVLKEPDRTETVTVFEKDDVKIFVKLGNNYSRRAAVLRQTGMKVFDKDHISGRIDFSAVVVLDGDSVNAYFKELENAEHTQWSDYRSSSREEASKKQNIFFGRLKDIIGELHIEDYETRLDSEGTSEYLPFAYVTGKKSNSVDTLSNEVKEKKKKTKKKRKKPETTFDEEEIQFEQDEAGNIIEDTINVRRGENVDPGPPNPNPVPGPIPNPNVDGIETTLSLSDKFVAKKIIPNNKFNYVLTKKSDEFVFAFIPKEDISNCFLEIKISGEQNAYDTLIVNAKIDGIEAEVNGSKVYLGSLDANIKHSISFDLRDKGDYSLEVNIYESKNK